MSCELKAILTTKTLTVELQGTYAGSGQCADGTVNIVNSEDTLLYSKDVASGGTAEQVIADQTAEGTTGLGAIYFPAGTIGTIPDVEYTDTDGSPASAPYGSAIACSAAADGTVKIKNSADTLLYTVEVGSGDTEEQVIPDQTAKVSGMVDTVSFPTNTQGVITQVWPTQTGQTTSIETGDDGDRQFGRTSDWLTLADNNEYGNTDRFVLLTSNIIHDCATGLLWYNTIIGAKSLADYISEAAALTVDGYTDWYVPNFKELDSILKFTTDPLNYSPFNYDAGTSGLMYLVTSNQWGTNPATIIASILIQSTNIPIVQSRNRASVSGGDTLKRALYCRPKYAA